MTRVFCGSADHKNCEHSGERRFADRRQPSNIILLPFDKRSAQMGPPLDLMPKQRLPNYRLLPAQA